jgi:hypothetical protein
MQKINMLLVIIGVNKSDTKPKKSGMNSTNTTPSSISVSSNKLIIKIDDEHGILSVPLQSSDLLCHYLLTP